MDLVFAFTYVTDDFAAERRRIKFIIIRVISRYDIKNTHDWLFFIELNELPPFAMCVPLIRSDYYGGSVAILDIQGLRP